MNIESLPNDVKVCIVKFAYGANLITIGIPDQHHHVFNKTFDSISVHIVSKHEVINKMHDLEDFEYLDGYKFNRSKLSCVLGLLVGFDYFAYENLRPR